MAQQQQLQRARKGPPKLERLEARITREQKRMIERAAGLRGTSVTEFVVVSAQQAAAKTIQDHGMMSLHGNASEAFVNAFLNPPTPTPAAKRAARRYRQRLTR